jgi:AraC-like DNA-binding protein
MDVLNDVLRSLRLKSTCYGRAEFTAPWGLRVSEHSDHASFFVVTRGSCWLEVEEAKKQIALAGGDFVLLPHANAFVLRDKPGSRPIELEKLLSRWDPNSKSLSYGGGGVLTSVVHGCFEFEGRETNPLISALPQLIHIKGEEGRAVPWLETTLQYLASETMSALPGSETVISHLTEILFIQAVRAHIGASGEASKKGLTRAITDPQIGQALAFIHNKPQESWTVESLASNVGMSRAGFAARFRELVGEPPVQYLTRWRMHQAAGLLRTGEVSLAEIADRVGYVANASFSKAFKRWMGSAPGAYRHTTQTSSTE